MTLPEVPGFAQPVTVTHKRTDDELVVAARERAGRARANDIIVCFVEWYRRVKATAGNVQAEATSADIAKRCEKLGA